MNILFIICDTLRRDFLGCYGNEWIKTPNIDKLAEESVVFDTAYIGSFPTMPARAEVMTGKHVFHTIGWAPLPRGETVVQSLLRRQGYVTMLITDHYQMLAPGMNYHQGFSGHRWIRGQQNDPYTTDDIPIQFPCDPSKCRQPEQLVVPFLRNRAYWVYERDWPIPRVIQEAVDWLERNYTHEKFLLYLDLFSIHEPWDPPQWYVDLYDPGYEGEKVILPRYDKVDYLTEEELRHVRALYAGTVTMMDKWVGWLLDKFRDVGIWDDTAVIFTSDHGWYLGEHGLIGKHTVLEPKRGWQFYDEVARIPLIIRIPGIQGGRRCEALVQLVDVMPTLAELGGARAPEGIHGRSLLPLLRGEVDKVRDLAVCSPRLPTDPETLVWSAVTDGEWSLMDGGALGKPELYHLPTDPKQQRDLFNEYRDIALRLHEEYLRFLSGIGTPEERIALRRWPDRE